MKPKFPKPNKEITSDFCKANFPIADAEKLISEFLFDVKERGFKDAIVRHELIIDEIDIPQEDDFEKARKLAKRVGKIKRYVSVGGGDEVMTEIDIRV